MRNILMMPMYVIVQSHIDGSGILQCFGRFETAETANVEIEQLSTLMSPIVYKWSVVPIWDVD